MEEIKARNSLLLITFIDLVGFGILLPILPFAALAVFATPLQIGLLAAAFSLFQILAMPFWGWAADRWGARPVLALSLLGNALSYLLFALAGTYGGLLFSRILAGITSATLGVARGSLTDPANPEATQKNMRFFGAAQGLGFLVGPILGALAQSASSSSPVWLAFGLALCAVPYVLWQKSLRAPTKADTLSLREKLRRLSSNPRLLRVNWVYGLLYLAFALLFISFPLLLKEAYGFDSHASAVYFSVLSVSAVFGQLVILPFCTRRFSNNKILLCSTAALAVFVRLLGFPMTPVLTGIVLAMTSILLFLDLPVLMAEIGLVAAASEKNLAAGVSESFAGLARLLGTVLSGMVIQWAGIGSVFTLSASTAVLALILISVNARKA